MTKDIFMSDTEIKFEIEDNVVIKWASDSWQALHIASWLHGHYLSSLPGTKLIYITAPLLANANQKRVKYLLEKFVQGSHSPATFPCSQFLTLVKRQHLLIINGNRNCTWWLWSNPFSLLLMTVSKFVW